MIVAVLSTLIFLFLATDLIIGNRWLPSKEGIIKTRHGYYKAYKYNRIFLVPIKMWYCFYAPENTTHITDFTSYSDATEFRTLEAAQDVLTSKRLFKKTTNHERYGIDFEVYSTKDKALGYDQIEDLIELATTDEEKRVLTSIAQRLKS